MSRRLHLAIAQLFVAALVAVPLGAQVPGALRLTPNLSGTIEHPLRYRPDGGDFVIRNGTEYFNRPLYGGNTAFRVDAGDRPEFSLYLPGRGGNVRLGIKSARGTKWLVDCDEVEARYRPGEMIYEIRDALLGAGRLRLVAVAMAATEGLVLSVEARGTPAGLELVWAYGGVNGQRGARDGDIGTEKVPIGEYFQLQPEFCRGNAFTIEGAGFTLRSKAATILGLMPAGTTLGVADAGQWSSFDALAASAGGPVPDLPVVIGRGPLSVDQPLLLAWQRLPAGETAGQELDTYLNVRSPRPGAPREVQALPLAAAYAAADLPRVFAETEAHFAALRGRVTIDTPDPFLNAAVGALNVAVDAVWDEPQGVVMHGAIAWRAKLLGWRGPYAQDELGWHDRARRHLAYWSRQQNTDPIPAKLPPPDEASNLARSEAALHSNGDLSNSHYDMNLVYIDALFRHLLWTGDLEFARETWPVIVRHLAWEQRLFRRPFGPSGLPLYEAYAAIWASDDLEYNGGGVTHASAYNYYHNLMAARVARLIGKDPVPYEREAKLILAAMHEQLWLGDRGWYAEYKDSLGVQLVHPAAALWTFYHAADAGVFTPQEAWQMTRYVDTELRHLPVKGPGVPTDQDYHVLSTTNWMPYAWSINNVVMGEVAHTALGYWQAGRADEAHRLLKGALLAAMYMGVCPGNVGTMSYLDVYRRESQRDFADGGGVLSRAFVEGLFGIKPDLLAGELVVSPGFPADWDHASLHHPDVAVSFQRMGEVETFSVESRFARPLGLRLQIPALRDAIAGVTVNGRPAPWRIIEESVGQPRVEIAAPAALRQEIVVTWQGKPITPTPREEPEYQQTGPAVSVKTPGLTVLGWADPQAAFSGMEVRADGVAFNPTGTPGWRTLFMHVRQGALTWWMALPYEMVPLQGRFDWFYRPPRDAASYRTIDLSARFNDRVTQIFCHEYRAPRSPYVSLAIPKQGIGGWAGGVNATAEIDDRGLRAKSAANAGRLVLPSGVPFATPGTGGAPNVIFTSQWDNYPREVTVPLDGRAKHVFLLMAGSTNWMQSRMVNGEVVFTYADGTTTTMSLANPYNWWPIEQDYFTDQYQFCLSALMPLRVDLKTGDVRATNGTQFTGTGGIIPGGAATVLDLMLDPAKELRSFTVRALANEVVLGLMAVTLDRGTDLPRGESR